MNEITTLMKQIILPSLWQTIYMIIIATILSFVIGFILAIVLAVTDERGIKPNKIIYGILSAIINVLRSVPFIILAVAIIPFTRSIVGTSIGENAAIVPLTIASAPFIARLIESSLKEVNPSLIEAAKSFGASNIQIIFKVMVKEAIPSINLDLTLATITILGLTAMAGAVGAGGLGAVGLTYGYQSFNDTIMYTTLILLVIIVGIIQFVGNIIYKKLK
ncbi:methionine ABC transporter permease [Clostridium botulinum]|uniref:ABC transporter permease n=2 Tax=Clostridium botulinum TaxID=1491 RepID=A0A846HY52_CLOBO|nr:methionine ABC transporter permease [Clostridium botulinum]AJD26275.1 binding--dependent transport system inner membrane component family protein [Clostridium botulinum CDC_297]EPS53078.1 methionine ABC transporter permease [Clostridium botulinum A1 str. CFSAN002368]ACQ52228.1 methionine ABC transporter, MUT family, permease protein [Clostridium botulinum Ba4 str. 657]AJE10348.1 binding--dependent transport system inner membrane component family protein [Clostridium botulinum CDC_1436]APR02